MGKKALQRDHNQKENINNTRVEAVLKLLKKQAPLTVKQVRGNCVSSFFFFFFFLFFSLV